MSVVSLSDILFSDLLTQTGMKPWWEKVRGYIFASSVALALSATYLTLQGIPVNCLPLANGNVSFTCKIDSVHAAWINTYCSNSIPWFIRYSGGMSLLAAIAMIAASSYWLHMPKVIDSFVSFSEMVKIISDCNMAFDDLHRMSFQPLKREDIEDRQLKLRQVCQEILQMNRANVCLKDMYRRRNCLLICVSVVVAISFTLIVYFMLSSCKEFHCNIRTNNLCMLQGKQSFPETAVCVYPMAHHLIVFSVLFTLSVAMQIFPIVYGVLNCNGWISNKWVTDPRHMNNLDFLSFFWRCGQPTWSETFSKLVNYVSGNEAKKDIHNSLKDAIMLEDDYVIRSFLMFFHSASSCDFYEGIIVAMVELYESALKDNTENEIENVENKIATVIDKFMTEEHLEHIYCEFLQKKKLETNWKMTTGAVNQYVAKLVTTGDDATVDVFNLLQKLKINYDILDKHGFSIMHYFLTIRRLDTISELLSERYEQTRGYELYRHYDGESTPVCVWTCTNIENLNNVDEANYGDSQHQLKQYHDKYLLILRGEASMDDDFIHGLSRIKFREWDADAKDFAIKAHTEKDWRTFVTLVNCYIIPSQMDDRQFPLDCGVTEGIEAAAILPALSYQKPFVTTAVKHIIICFTSDQNVEARRLVESSTLRPRDKDKWKEFIRNYKSASEQAKSTVWRVPDNRNTQPLRIIPHPQISTAQINSNSITSSMQNESDSDRLIPTPTNI